MKQHLPAKRELGSGVRIEIPQEQRRLKKQHAGVPHLRRASQTRQNQLADERLKQEKQKCADEKSDREKRQGQGPPPKTSKSTFTSTHRPKTVRPKSKSHSRRSWCKGQQG